MASQFPTYPSAHIEYHIITPLGRCAHINSNLKRAENELERLGNPGWKLVKVVTTKYDVTPLTDEEIDYHIDHVWSLSQYIQWLNRHTVDSDEPLLCEELDHWYSMEISTPRHLADYLDACVKKETKPELTVVE